MDTIDLYLVEWVSWQRGAVRTASYTLPPALTFLSGRRPIRRFSHINGLLPINNEMAERSPAHSIIYTFRSFVTFIVTLLNISIKDFRISRYRLEQLICLHFVHSDASGTTQ